MSDRTVDSFQVSPQQEHVWAAETEAPTARTQAVLAIVGALDASALLDALRATVDRHESLRTTFVRQAGLTFPLQAVHGSLEPHLETLDLTAMSPQERAERVAEVRRSELQAPFDLEQGPLVRAMLVTTEENRERARPDALGAVRRRDLDFAAARRARAASSALERARGGSAPVRGLLRLAARAERLRRRRGARRARVWEELEELSSPTLPFARSANRPRDGGGRARSRSTTLSRGALRAGGDATERSPATLAQAAWHAVLGRAQRRRRPPWSRSSPASAPRRPRGRDRRVRAPGADPDRSRSGRAPSPRSSSELDRGTRRRAGTGRTTLPRRPPGRGDRVRRARRDRAAGGSGATVEQVAHHQPAPAPRARVRDRRRAREAGPVLRPEPLRARDGRGLADGLVRMLAAVAADPGVALGDVELLSDGERVRVLREFNDTAAPTGAGVRARAVRTLRRSRRPSGGAVIDGDELDHLRRARRARQPARAPPAPGRRRPRRGRRPVHRPLDRDGRRPARASSRPAARTCRCTTSIRPRDWCHQLATTGAR